MKFSPFEVYRVPTPRLLDQIKRRREKLGINQRHMAKMIGCTQGFYSKIEAGLVKWPCLPVEQMRSVLKLTKERWLSVNPGGDFEIKPERQISRSA